MVPGIWKWLELVIFIALATRESNSSIHTALTK
jgi:hypothetical protein